MATLATDLILRENLSAAARGDHDAYGRIVLSCQNTVTAIALSITRDVQASEDIAQEAFLRAWHHLGRLKNADSFLPWLRQITRNLARDHLESRARHAMTGEQAELALELAADTAPTPAERALHTEQERAAAEVIAALPEDSRETLLLYYREGQRSQQVADLLGLTDAAVRKRLSRARQQVREELMARFGEFARSSAPSAAFASAVAGLIAIAAPPTAAAAVLGAGTGVAGKGALKLLGASAGAVAIGMIAGISAIWYGIRKPLRQPLDRRERNGLLLYGLFNTALVIAFVLALTTLARMPGWVPHVLVSLGYMAGILWSSMYWLPRILARRRARDMRLDPQGTLEKQRRERRWQSIGAVVGIGLAMAALVLGLILGGRVGF